MSKKNSKKRCSFIGQKKDNKKEKLLSGMIMGLMILLLGVTSNLLVLKSNQFMPIITKEEIIVENNLYRVFEYANETIKLPFLADIYEIKIEEDFIYYSVGDVFIASGIIIFIFFEVSYFRIKEKEKKKSRTFIRTFLKKLSRSFFAVFKK